MLIEGRALRQSNSRPLIQSENHTARPSAQLIWQKAGVKAPWLSIKLWSTHNIIKQYGFIYVDPKNITMGCPNLVQLHTLFESPYTMLGHPMPNPLVVIK